MTFYVDSHPRARKPHVCGSCSRTIRPGETYRRGAGMDGTAWTFKECAHCEALLTYVFRLYGEYEYIGDELVDGWDPETVEHLRIKAQWKRKWTRLDGDLYPAPVIEWHYRDDTGFPTSLSLHIGGPR